MQTATLLLRTGMRSLSYAGGTAVIALAIGVYVTSSQPAVIANWALEVFGLSFIVLLTTLSFIVAFAWTRMMAIAEDPSRREFWLTCGLQAASGVSTLALTYTLLGISLGIGTLAEQELNTDTVQALIRNLTDHFSMAFLTTVIGLPLSAVLRALVIITEMHIRSSGPQIKRLKEEIVQ